VLGQVGLVERDDHRQPRRLARNQAHVEERLAEGRLGGEENHHLVDVGGDRLLFPLVGAVEKVAAGADALDRSLRGAGEAHLDEIAAGRVLALALAGADDLAPVGEFHQELAPEIGDDAAFDNHLFGFFPARGHAGAVTARRARRASRRR
jgi:hypothetical protein